MAQQQLTDCELEMLKSRFNLEDFMKKLTLEPMLHGEHAPPMPPPKARSTMTPLVMRPGGYRKLQEIKGMDYLEAEAAFFFNNLNAELGDGEPFKALKLASQIPTKQMEKTLLFNPYEVDNRHAVLFAIERGPIMSAQKLAHAIDTELQELRFFTPRRNGTLNNQGIEPMYFCTLDESQAMESVKCVVVSVAPWEFAPQDFEDFTSMGAFDDGSTSLNGKKNHPPWRNAEVMWAYLHDLCMMHDCQHFVLTSYEEWAFGAFSTFYTTGFVSQAIPWNAKPASVLELFTYWLLAACHSHNTMMLEEVSNEAQVYNYYHEAFCAIGDLFEADPDAIMALYFVPMEKHIDCDLFEKERQLSAKRMLDDGLRGTSLDRTTEDAPPAKRARKDPQEDRIGWQPLSQHTFTRFPSPYKLRQFESSTTRVYRKVQPASRETDFTFAKPSTQWNRWKMRRGTVKENPSPSREVQDSDTPTPIACLQLGHPIPCYSLDVDRDNDRFRPELIRFASFPIPPP